MASQKSKEMSNSDLILKIDLLSRKVQRAQWDILEVKAPIGSRKLPFSANKWRRKKLLTYIVC